MTTPMPAFPRSRPRRLRQNAKIRGMVREHELGPSNLILPLFVIEGRGLTEEVRSMPGVLRHSIDGMVEQARQAHDLGIPAVALFPNTPPEKRDERGEEALNPDNLVCRATRAIKDAVPDLLVICDVALDPYTDHGHDGLIEDGVVVNDASIEMLVGQSLNQYRAGCDIIAPSDMMDGRVVAIRDALDAEGGQDCMIMSYAAKYASCFYGPFRDAVGASSQLKGDKKTYQMDPANSDEAMREIASDIAEGADMVMVKPGMPYLDIIARASSRFETPVFAYQVSGEYAMIEWAAASGALDRKKAHMEALLCFRRAGASGILTYFAKDAAQLLRA
ncbi:MAG: porphobilinogen synthase [SAR116 cluster bacterium]|nr:porphobilinogen synthase [Paracoccaceae bacterium]RCL81408.1 MAG: porphobilinogen synthase [SAR116 cluster bacterium]RPH14004.1 MAG: porphobilinogen synthase [Alphaproteobacteria bacterium TMED150]